MHIHLSARHLKLTPSIQSYVTQKLSHLEEMSDEIIGVHVVLWQEEKSGKPGSFHIKVDIAVPGPNIYIEEKDNVLYAAIDKAENKLERQLRKRKTRLKDSPRHKAKIKAEKSKKFGI